MSQDSEENPVVSAPAGKVRGRKCHKPDKEGAKQSYRFSGIPFAKPPVGELRFERPVRCDKWEGVLDGTGIGKIPMQAIEMLRGMDVYFAYSNEFGENFDQIDEDCLYLKIYTNNPNPNAKMPVLFWIYGGGFQMGETCSYDGNVLASLHDVVVVMANYRVNVFGLLSMEKGTTSCNGNLTLFDQACALEWVRDNIKSFGGDPRNVTIFGESAGAGSVCCHVYSHFSRHLFHRAISHSGALDNSMVMDGSEAARKRFLSKLGLDDEHDPHQVLQKLKFKFTSKEINDAYTAILYEEKYFSVVVDGTFIKSMPDELISGTPSHEVPYMIGTNSTEGCGLLAPGQDKGFADGITADDARQALKGWVMQMFPHANDQAAVEAAIWDKYSSLFANDESDAMRYSRLLGEATADFIFVTQCLRIAKAHSGAGNPTFYYQMNHRLRFSHDKEFQPAEGAVFKADICECDHGDDLVFTFGLPHTNAKMQSIDVKFDSDERKLTDLWQQYLVNFATSGDPNVGKYKPEVEWERFEADEEKYLLVNSSPQMKAKFFDGDRYQFWMKTVKELLSKK